MRLIISTLGIRLTAGDSIFRQITVKYSESDVTLDFSMFHRLSGYGQSETIDYAKAYKYGP